MNHVADHFGQWPDMQFDTCAVQAISIALERAVHWYAKGRRTAGRCRARVCAEERNRMSDADPITIEDKVSFLRRGDSYPTNRGDVEVVETHLSWVFLTATRVYKMKKPVCRGFVDLGTLARRRRNCAEEVRLNRRLAPDVYLGVVALTATDSGLALGGPGRAVEWLVEMRRLARHRMLDTAIRTRTVERAQIDAVGRLLGAFYRGTPPFPIAPADYLARARRWMEESLHVVEAADLLDGACAARTGRALREYVRQAGDGLAARAATRRIVEGHGDLRPEHVHLSDPPIIIDCLEFNRDFRMLDPVEEIAYLGLECEVLGAGWIGRAVLERYASISGDRPPAALVAFYTAARALLRAKLCVWRLADCAPERRPHWSERARRYLALAALHAEACVAGVSPLGPAGA